MKSYLSGIIIVLLCTVSACSKDKTGPATATVTAEEQAKAAFSNIDVLWTSTLKPVLTKEAQTYTGKVLEDGAGGKAIVNGSFTRSSSSSSSSTRSNSEADVTITFQQYEINGLRLDGVLRFYESHSSRTACSSSGCASSSDNYYSYSSDGGSGVTNPPVSIEFEYNGQQYKDLILLDADREFSSWSVDLINGSGQTFSFSY